MEIKVEAQAERLVQPEWATLQVDISCEGTDRQAVMETVRSLSVELADAVPTLVPHAVSKWSLSPVRVHSWTTGRRGGILRCAASARARLTFLDLTALGDFCQHWGQYEHVELLPVEWELSPPTQATVEEELLVEAVASTRRRAAVLAQAADTQLTACTHLSDNWDSLPVHRHSGPLAASFHSRAVEDSAPVLPEDLRLTVTVFAQYSAD